ncbi:Acyl-ACP thioesterase [Corchorus olitorius]|uniref:Acyl-ACP thioesterase n=1 Tax=Corchorus olitorius TaxID=93759 RepID=A0A1R3KL95_9ROSI|nr:Acyl-ACP thioesterase [Corchorus olitorius]
MNGLRACVGIHENGYISEEQIGQKFSIPGKKQLVDPYRQGLIIERGVGYRQTVVIRNGIKSCVDVWTFEQWIWSHTWNDEPQSHLGGLKNAPPTPSLSHLVRGGGNGYMGWSFRQEWDETRLANSKSSHLASLMQPQLDKHAIKEEIPEKFVKLDQNAKYVNSDLKAKRSDLDMNHHVNNVKYVRWMLETIPDKFLESHQLSSIILEYRRECGSSDIVESLCQPDEDGTAAFANGFAVQHKTVDLSPGNGYTHFLHVKGETRNEEIVRGRTRWKQKLSTMPYSFINKL